MRIIGEMAKVLAFLVRFFHVFFPGRPLHFARHFHPGGTAFCATRGETKNDGHPPFPTPHANSRRRRTSPFVTKRNAQGLTAGERTARQSGEKTPPQRAPGARKNRRWSVQTTRCGAENTGKGEKWTKKNGNEPSHDETFPHRTYIEMKKLSRNLVVNVTTSTTMVGAVSLTPRKYGQKSNRPNIYPIFFIQIVNDFATF